MEGHCRSCQEAIYFPPAQAAGAGACHIELTTRRHEAHEPPLVWASSTLLSSGLYYRTHSHIPEMVVVKAKHTFFLINLFYP